MRALSLLAFLGISCAHSTRASYAGKPLEDDRIYVCLKAKDEDADCVTYEEFLGAMKTTKHEKLHYQELRWNSDDALYTDPIPDCLPSGQIPQAEDL